MKVYKTKDYSKFNYLDGNRNIVKAHVKKLIDSIVKYNLLASNPIIVNEKYEIIDGQHRLEAAEQLNEDIYYIILNTASLNHVHLLNENMKKWSVQDYVDSYSSLGKQDYIILNDFSKKYNLPVGVCMELLSEVGGRQYIVFKQGGFKINGIKNAETTANTLRDFAPFVDKGLEKTSNFARAIRYLVKVKKIDLGELVRKVSASGTKIHRQANAKLYLRVLEDIYNKHKHVPVRLY